MTINDAARQIITMVRFDYNDTGTPQYTAYTNGDSNVSHTTYGNFTSLPALSVEMPKLDGMIEDKAAEIEMEEAAPFIIYNTGEAFPVIQATIYIADPEDVENTAQIMFSGRISRVLKNADGVPGVMRAYVSGWRSFAKDRAFGLSATSTCLWTFGDRSCLFDVEAQTVSCIITAINGTTVTTDIDEGDINTQGWSRGSLRRGDLALMIRSYTVPTAPDTYTFTLSRKAPIRWLNQQVTLYPGCTKDLNSCIFWNNEERFGGCGIVIPAENPLYSGV